MKEATDLIGMMIEASGKSSSEFSDELTTNILKEPEEEFLAKSPKVVKLNSSGPRKYLLTGEWKKNQSFQI